MKVWWCEAHDCASGEMSAPDEILESVCWVWHHEKHIPCRMVEMQLVPADALVVVKENGEWPTLLVMELAGLLAYTRYDDDPVQYHEARKFLDDLAAANV